MKKQASVKSKFFNELEQASKPYFSSADIKEILEDYKMFYEEKILAGESEKEIIEGLGNPEAIVDTLVKEANENGEEKSSIDEVNQKKKRIIQVELGILDLKNWILAARGIWLIVTVLFIGLFQFGNMYGATGSFLVIMQVLSFWFGFSYKKVINNKAKKEKLKFPKMNIVYGIATSFITVFYALVMLRFSFDIESTPIIGKMPLSFVGPFIHYAIFLAIIIGFVFLYKSLLNDSRIGLQLHTLIIHLISLIILTNIHSRLQVLVSQAEFAYYMENQVIVYVLVFLINIPVTIYIISAYKSKGEVQ